MSKWDWGYLYWALWIFVMFLVPELLGYFHTAPWPTLSSTSWHAERTYPILRSLLFGFLIGLAVHIRFQTALGRAEAGGMAVALALHFAGLV